MNRFWSLLFFLVPVVGMAAYGMAIYQIPPLADAWLPASQSEAGETIDHLFYLIHGIAAVIFVGTGWVLGTLIWKFDARQRDRAAYVTHNTRLEIIWSVIPAAILLFIAFYQMNAWSEQKMNRPTVTIDGQSVPQPPAVRIVASQFSWGCFYPGADGKLGTVDDDYLENELVVPAGREIVLQLESADVIHSFFVPQLRLKQDVVPGMTQFVWFRVKRPGEMEIACAELCGWGHYRMKGRLRAVSPSDFAEWQAERQQCLIPPLRGDTDSDASPDSDSSDSKEALRDE